MCFESSNFMTLRNGKVEEKFLSKHFAENGKKNSH